MPLMTPGDLERLTDEVVDTLAAHVQALDRLGQRNAGPGAQDAIAAEYDCRLRAQTALYDLMKPFNEALEQDQ